MVNISILNDTELDDFIKFVEKQRDYHQHKLDSCIKILDLCYLERFNRNLEHSSF